MNAQDADAARQFEQALAHHESGRLPQAIEGYRRVVAGRPDHVDAWNNLANALLASGRLDEAIAAYQQAMALRPDVAALHYNLGNALATQGRIDDAIGRFRRAIELNPSLAAAHNNLGRLLKEKALLNESVASLRTAIALNPAHASAHNNLGAVLEQLGHIEDAVGCYRQAAAINPAAAVAHASLGRALARAGRVDEAIEACQRAIALQPALAEAHANLGNALTSKERLEEAVTCYEKAISLCPNCAPFHHNRGNALVMQGRVDDAIASYRRAIELRPDDIDSHSRLLLLLNLHPDVDAAAIGRESKQWNHLHAARFKSDIRQHPNSRDADRRLRIGYVSADFHEHACAHFLYPLYAAHDRERFEIYSYAHDAAPDELTRRFLAMCDVWRSTVGRSDVQLAEQIRADGIDILVDLKLHTDNNRLLLFARKPAPVQATWLGYPGTTGLDAIDYRLSDPKLDPPGIDESVYAEKTVRLTDTFWCYDPIASELPSVNALPALTNGFVTFGCLNNFCKVSDQTLRTWARVLQAKPASRLLLQAPVGFARRRVLAALEAHGGVRPDRVEFLPNVPRQQYLSFYHRIDVALDTLPYNGHTTSLDALWMGVPVVTQVGRTVVGRAGSSQLTNLGLGELIASSDEQFVEIATRLACDPQRVAGLRSTLRPRMQASALMDAPRFARNIEAAYRQMWRAWCAAG